VREILARPPRSYLDDAQERELERIELSGFRELAPDLAAAPSGRDLQGAR
jgi:hypothetical protein